MRFKSGEEQAHKEEDYHQLTSIVIEISTISILRTKSTPRRTDGVRNISMHHTLATTTTKSNRPSCRRSNCFKQNTILKTNSQCSNPPFKPSIWVVPHQSLAPVLQSAVEGPPLLLHSSTSNCHLLGSRIIKTW